MLRRTKSDVSPDTKAAREAAAAAALKSDAAKTAAAYLKLHPQLQSYELAPYVTPAQSEVLRKPTGATWDAKALEHPVDGSTLTWTGETVLASSAQATESQHVVRAGIGGKVRRVKACQRFSTISLASYV